MILPVHKKLELIHRASNGEKITALCLEYGISRYSFYKYWQRFNKNKNEDALTDRRLKNKGSINKCTRAREEAVLDIVKRNPILSSHQISNDLKSRGIKVSNHGVQRILERKALNKKINRQTFLQEEGGSPEFFWSEKLAPEQKLCLVLEVLEKHANTASLCRRYNLSRYTLYKWIARYKENPNNWRESLASKRASGNNHWRKLRSDKVNQVLEQVSIHPEYSVGKLTTLLKGIVGHHGIQNILAENGLNNYSLRLAYAQNQNTTIAPALKVPQKSWDGRIKSVFETFTPTRAPAPPFAPSELQSGTASLRKLLKPFFCSFILTLISTFLALNWLSSFASQGVVNSIGLLLATVALFVGTIFFLYSMKYYLAMVLVLSFTVSEKKNLELMPKNKSIWSLLGLIFGISISTKGREEEAREPKINGLESNLNHIILNRKPLVSIQLPYYNEAKVAERSIRACAGMDYFENGRPNFEVLVCDDSNDETIEIVNKVANEINKEFSCELVKVLHRPTREGFKGGALSFALKAMDPRSEFVVVFDADFVPYPDTLTQFVKYYKATGTWDESKSFTSEDIRTVQYATNENIILTAEEKEWQEKQLEALRQKSSNAVVAGYQWHVLNKSENWITRGVRTEYSGSYVIERPSQEIMGAMKIIHGSVYMMRADVLKHFGWGTSITEDYELTLRIYEKGFKVIFTPYVQAPSECVSTIKRLIRQRMRWAEGHSYNTKRMFKRLFSSPLMTKTEKVEFAYLSPYYLQAALFLIGTFAWLISETIFQVRLPFWTSLWGWSLVLTNLFALPLLNAIGLFLEEAEEKDYSGLVSFMILSYLVVPFQAYAAIKGFIEPKEGTWFRTPKTGRVTDVLVRGRFYSWLTHFFPAFNHKTSGIAHDHLSVAPNLYFNLSTSHNVFNQFSINRKRNRVWGRLALSIMLLISTTLVTLSPMVPLFVKPKLANAQGFGVLDASQSAYAAENKNEPVSVTYPNLESGIPTGAISIPTLVPTIQPTITPVLEPVPTDIYQENTSSIILPTQAFEITYQEQKQEIVFPESDLSSTCLLPENYTEEQIVAVGCLDKNFKTIKEDFAAGEPVKIDFQKEDPNNYKVEIINFQGEKTLVTTNQNQNLLEITSLNEIRPGKYTARVFDINDSMLEQDFTWGVLAFNTNKSIYLVGETVALSFGTVDDNGHTLCDSEIEATITNPFHISKTLKTADGTILKSDECRGDSVTTKPDYSAEYRVLVGGTYKIEVIAQTTNGTRTFSDIFEVKDMVPFEVERVDFPTRIYPGSPYEVKLAIKPNQDFKGIITEKVPVTFGIDNISNNGEIFATETEKTISWEMDLRNGENYTLAYTINFPPKSPEFYLLGPVRFISENPSLSVVFAEQRQWQIAADAAKTWDGGGWDNNWSTPQNWSGDTVPAAGDDLTFNGGGVLKDSTVNATFSGTIYSITISAGYTQTLTLSRNLVVTTFLTQSDGIFVSGSNTLDINTHLTINSGANFTASSGTMTVANNLTINSGATFANGSGTLTIDGSSSSTLSCGSKSFNLVTFNKPSWSADITIGSDCIAYPLSLGDNPIATAGSITNNGAITAGTGTWILNADFIQSSSSATATFSGTIVDMNFAGSSGVYPADLTLAGGVLTASSLTTLNIEGEFDNSGNLLPTDLTVTFNGSDYGGDTTNVTCSGSENFTKVTINKAMYNSTFSIGSDCVFPFGDSAIITSGVLTNNGDVSVGSGIWTLYASYTQSDAGATTTFTGTTIDVNKQANAGLTAGSLTLTGGSLTAENMTTLTVNGNLNNSADLLPASITTITFDGSDAYCDSTITCGSSALPGIADIEKTNTGHTISIGSTCIIDFGNSASFTATTVTNSGDITVGTGTWVLNTSFTQSDAGASITFNGTTIDMNYINNSSGSGPAALTLTGGTMISTSLTNVNILGNFDNSGDVLREGITLLVEGAITAADSTLTCGDADDFALVTFSKTAYNADVLINSGCTIPLGNSAVSSGGTITNEGIINVGDGTWTMNMSFLQSAATGSTTFTGTTIDVNKRASNISYAASFALTGGSFTGDNMTNINVVANLNNSADLLPEGLIFTTDGNYTSDDSTITCGDADDFSLVNISKTDDEANVVISDGCTFPLGDDAISSAGTITNNGVVTVGSGTWTINATYTQSSATGSTTFTGTTIDINYSASITTTTGSLNLTAGSFTALSLTTIYAIANINNSAGLLPNGIALTLDGGNLYCDSTVTSGGATFSSLTINKADNGAYTTFVGNLTLTGNFDRNNGPISNPASPMVLSIGGNMILTTTDALAAANLTIKLNGSNTQSIAQNAAMTISSPIQIDKTGTNVASISANFTSAANINVVEGILDLNGFNATTSATLTVEDGGTLRLIGSEFVAIPALNDGSTVTYKGNDNDLADTYAPYFWDYSNLNVEFADSGDVLSGAALNTGLYGYWNMDEASGTVVADSSGNNREATASGATVTTGKISNGRAFASASSQYISLPTGFADFTSGLTISMWVNPTSATSWARFLDIGNGAPSNNILLARSTTTTTLVYEVYNGTTTGGQITVTSAIGLGAWQHFLVTEDHLGNVKIYKNGVLIKEGTTGVPTNIERTQNYIGKSNWAANAYYNGVGDDFRMYNRVLSAMEITALVNANTALPTSLTVNGNLTIGSGTFIPPATLNIGGSYNNSGGTFTHNNGLVEFTSTSAGKTLAGTMIGSSSFYNLTFDGASGGWGFGANSATIANDFVITNGSVTAPSTNLTIGQDFTNNATFAANSGTVVFNDNAKTSTITYSAATTFVNLTCSTASKVLEFDNVDQTNITGTLTINGGSCDTPVQMNSDSAGNQYDLNATGTKSVQYASIKDSNAIAAASAISSTSVSNNNGWTITADNCTSSTVSTATGYSFQRKTWYDGRRMWKSFNANSQIEFWYSEDNGVTWAENTSARIAIDTFDFSVEATSAGVLVAYTDGYDIKVASGGTSESYPGIGYSWANTTTVYDGSGATDEFDYPAITKDSNNKIWVAATHHSGSDYIFKTIQSTNADNVTAWEAASSLDTSTNSNKYGTISSLGSGSVYATWIDGTDIEGKKYGSNSTTTDFPADTADGHITGFDTSQAAARNTSDDYNVAANNMNVGAQRDGISSYTYWRGFFKFDTSGIGTGSTVTQANLTFTAIFDQSSTDFDVQIAKYDWSEWAGDQTNATYRETAYDGCLAAALDDNIWRNTSGMSTLTPYTSGDLSVANVVTDGVTYYCLRTSTDTNNTFLGVNNYYINLATQNHATEAYRPVLTVSYTSSAWDSEPTTIGTGKSGMTTNLSMAVDTSNNLHLAWIDDGDDVTYKKYSSGAWDVAATDIETSANTNVTVSIDTATNNVYIIYLRSGTAYFKKYTDSWQTETNTNWTEDTSPAGLTSNHSGYNMVFGEWSSGAGSPYTIHWDDVLLPVVGANATGYSFQRKTWDDGTRFWRAFNANSQIEFWYSTDSGNNWVENTTARIAIDTFDFSIEASSSAIFIGYTDGYDIKVASSSALQSYPSTGYSWAGTTTVYDGNSATDEFDYPVLARDSNSKIWVAATHHSSTDYIYKAVQATNADDITAWGTPTSLDTSTNSNKYGTIVSLGSGSVYATWIDGTAIEGKKYSSNSTTTDFPGSTTEVMITGGPDKVTSATYDTTTTALSVGASRITTAGSEQHYRLFYLFDTSDIGASSTVTQANLTLTATADAGGTDQDIQIIKYDWSAYAADLTNATNRETAYDGIISADLDDSIWRNTNGMSLNTGYTSGNLSTAWVSKTGTTYYGIMGKLDRDTAAGAQPNFSAYNITLAMTDHATADYRPVLTVSYTSSAWDSSPTVIATGTTGLGNNMSAVVDSNGKIHLTYVDSSGNIKYSKYSPETITYDNASTLSGETSIGAKSWDHTIGSGSNRALVVGTSIGGTTTVTSVTYNNIDLDNIGTDSNGGETGLWILKEANLPAAGTYSITVNMTSGIKDYVFGATSWSGVSQTDTYGTFVSATGNDTAPTIDVTSGTGQMVVDDMGAFAGSAATATVGTNQTSRWNASTSPFDGVRTQGAGSHESGAGTVTMSWTLSGSKTWAIGAVPLKPSIWGGAVALDSNAGNAYTTISLDTATSDLYAMWIRNNHIYYKKADYAASAWTWDANATDWKTTTNGAWLTSNYSGSGMIFAMWTSGTTSPYTVNWDFIIIPERIVWFLALGLLLPKLLRRRSKKLNIRESENSDDQRI